MTHLPHDKFGYGYGSCDTFILMLHYGPVYTMDHEVGPWKMVFLMVRFDGSTCMVQFLKLKPFTKFLGPLPSLNSMWIKRNDHALKKRVDFFYTCPKRVVLKKK